MLLLLLSLLLLHSITFFSRAHARAYCHKSFCVRTFSMFLFPLEKYKVESGWFHTRALVRSQQRHTHTRAHRKCRFATAKQKDIKANGVFYQIRHTAKQIEGMTLGALRFSCYKMTVCCVLGASVLCCGFASLSRTKQKPTSPAVTYFSRSFDEVANEQPPQLFFCMLRPKEKIQCCNSEHANEEHASPYTYCFSTFPPPSTLLL